MHFNGLVFNEEGYERALAAGTKAIAISASVSYTIGRANSGMSNDRSLEMARKLIGWSRCDRLWVRIYISTAWVCPFKGPVRPERTIACAEEIWAMEVDELAMADTIGHANPPEIAVLMEQL